MSSEDFVRGFLGLFPDSNFNEVSWVNIDVDNNLR